MSARAHTVPDGYTHVVELSYSLRLPAIRTKPQDATPYELRCAAITTYCWARDRVKNSDDEDGLDAWCDRAKKVQDRPLKQLSGRSDATAQVAR